MITKTYEDIHELRLEIKFNVKLLKTLDSASEQYRSLYYETEELIESI